ncbi:TonB-dependent receptor plug domain-containing protein [Sphingomicrobium nitratireducens]|uniref:TonB-dependent receptor plug domain-containing protein n=1 Tax=Sphingomicrobium nitratireducens TaxID=2964666 RepID=UPI00223EF9C6|nr:TonB-dependent receptor plug domain-containing protein [Sphingomicrobium nitratireducens]
MRSSVFLGCSSLAAIALAGSVQAQTAQSDDGVRVEREGGEETIIVEAPRGSVPGQIEPEYVLDARDVMATGATSIEELLDALSPQIGSVRGGGGGRPVILIEGRRVSGWRELRDLPPEAIERVDILPEEVALQYGYKPDQRVVNFVLRERFNSTTLQLEGRGATRGGRAGGEIDIDRLILRGGTRTSIAFDAEHDGMLREDERDILLVPVGTVPDATDPRPYRSLLPNRERYRLNATHRRPLGDKGLSVNLGLEQNDTASLFGAPVVGLDLPADSPFADPPGAETSVLRLVGTDPLGRRSRSREAQVAAALTSEPGDWRWSMTANMGIADATSRRDRGADLSALQDAIDLLDPEADPLGDFGAPPSLPVDESYSLTRTAGIDALVNGTLADTDAGAITLTLKGEAGMLDFRSKSIRDGASDPDTDLFRRRLNAASSLELPLLSRDSGVGKLALNANAGIESLSDFGELTSFGGGFAWGPTKRLDLIGSWGREEIAPTLTQLGDPRLAEPLTRFFDFTTGETVLLTAISGGNPDLRAEERDVAKLAANWSIPAKNDLSLRVEYVRERIANPVARFPAASEAIESAFPDRFVRDGEGRLVAVDLTPVNYDSQRRDQLRWGLDFSKSLKTKPPSAEAIGRFRERFRQRRDEGQAPPPPDGEQQQQAPQGQQPASETPPPERQQGQRGPRRGGGGRFGGGQGGRLFGSVFHTVTLADDVTIAPGLPRLDYLGGEALSGFGGRSRHEVTVQGGRYNNGLGLRVTANWRSATSVDSGDGTLDFSSYSKVDLRAWLNLTERFDTLSKKPWLAGTSLRLAVDNLLDQRPKVTGPDGDVPLGYQPALLEPAGRTVSISIRKIFVPRSFFRDMRRERMQGGS